jgi:hypothetical protein
MSVFVRASVLMLGVVAAAGCATKAPLVTQCKMPWRGGDRAGMPALVGLEYGERATPIPLNSVQFSGPDAVKLLSIQRLAASRTPTNTVEVAARFVSCSDAPQSVRVRTAFLAANQAAAEPPSAWQTVYLAPHLTANYSERSISPNVQNYLIEITQ